MSQAARDAELRIRGIGLRARFALAMTAALALVVSIAGVLLYQNTLRIATRAQRDAIAESVRLTQRSTQEPQPYQTESPGREHESGVKLYPFRAKDGRTGTLYVIGDSPLAPGPSLRLLVPESAGIGRPLLQLIGAILLAVVLVGAAVALWVANQVSRPIRMLIDDVRQIARGELQHKTRVVGSGEVELLSRSIERMTRDLEVARETETELSSHERERELAAGVREALLPLATPWVEGYDLGAAFLASPEFGGDFHDFVVLADGRVGLLVCDVSGSGFPAALIGATARCYLRTELACADDVSQAFARVNRWLAEDVRRGMFVTALYALVDPAAGMATVVSAGHKIPLLRYCASEGSLRTVHPDGIAFGFDKGPVFERRLQRVEVPIDAGDRIVLTNSAPVALSTPDGRELGEKVFYARILKHAPLDTQQFLKQLKRDLEQAVGETGVQRDVSLVTLRRGAVS